MCLAVPGKIVSIEERGRMARTARVSFGGVVKQVNLAYTPEAQVDDYVTVHVGFALSIIDEQEAIEQLSFLQQLVGGSGESEVPS